MAEVYGRHVFSLHAVVAMEIQLRYVRGEMEFWIILNRTSHFRYIALSIVAEALARLIRLGPQPVTSATMSEKAHLLEILYTIEYRCLGNSFRF